MKNVEWFVVSLKKKKADMFSLISPHLSFPLTCYLCSLPKLGHLAGSPDHSKNLEQCTSRYIYSIILYCVLLHLPYFSRKARKCIFSFFRGIFAAKKLSRKSRNKLLSKAVSALCVSIVILSAFLFFLPLFLHGRLYSNYSCHLFSSSDT
jgi:hypothetical protein